MRNALLSLTVLAATAVVPAAASANTSVAVDASGTIQVRAAAGETNHIGSETVASPTIGARLFDNLQTTVARAGCSAAAAGGAFCPPAAIAVHLNDGDDAAKVDDLSGGNSVTIDGGAGNDDILSGSSGLAAASGGAGNDVVVVAANTRGTGTGGSGNDQLAGRSGSDALSGGAGSDLLTEQPGFSSGTLSGDGGADRIVTSGSYFAQADGGDGPDLVIGGATSFLAGPSLAGGNGADQIVSDGHATIDGGAGNDQIDAANGQPDTITCGDGRDMVWADPTDTVAADCETVLPGPAPGFAGTAQARADAAALLTHVPDIG